MTTLNANVQRGAALLDENVPDWASVIDFDNFDLDSTTMCVLGQVSRKAAVEIDVRCSCGCGSTFGDPAQSLARQMLGRPANEYLDWGSTLAGYGFFAPYEQKDAVTELWQAAVAERVAA